jgi:hypothetical protein
MMQNQTDRVSNNPITQTNDLRTMFQKHGNQFLKFHFIPFLTAEERTNMRGTCQTIKQNIPKSQYSYFYTCDGDAIARIETIVGCVETRGNSDYGGDSSEVSSELQYGVQTIVATLAAFAALKTNGRVITWGDPELGGDSSSVSFDLQVDVKTVFSNDCAFAALKTNGKVITWGDPENGGNSSSVSSDLQFDVKTVVSNSYAFAALKTNGRVITWGSPEFGGDSSHVSEFLQNGVIQIEAVDYYYKFCATKSDGTQIQWS